jgi:hypothetical protein
MQEFKLSDMLGGWFIGNFQPAVIGTDQFEVAIKHYQAGAKEARHHHKVAWEITAIASGAVRMRGREFGPGAIIHLQPGESTDFEALEDTITVVVKSPSVVGDKYLDESSCH